MKLANHMGVLVVMGVIAVAGCASKKPLAPLGDGGDSMMSGSDSDSASSGSMSGSSIRSAGFGEDSMDADTADALIIYFDYDKSEVSPQYADLLAAHARRLARDSSQQLRLEGHADERGSREYNIGLGERRAQAVRRLLLIQGASSSQISTVSYGEERPAAYGSTESDYQKNRRVELSYR